LGHPDIVLNIIRRRGAYHSVGNQARVFSTWRAQTGSSIILPSTALSRIM